MPSPPITIQPIEHPFDVTFPDVERGIPPIPGSKSLTNRALLLAALAEGTSTLTGVLFSDDTKVMMKALQDLDVQLEVSEPNHEVGVVGRRTFAPVKAWNDPPIELTLGNAGTATRFLTAACAASPGLRCRVDGIERMRQRTIKELVDVLVEHGADIKYELEPGFPPLLIEGVNIDGGKMKMRATISSQYVSAVLISSFLFNHGYTPTFVLKFDGPVVSWPYIEITVKMMRQFGVKASTGWRSVMVPNLASYKGRDYAIEPDASNASYFLAAAALIDGASCTLGNLGKTALQGDAKFYTVLKQMGPKVRATKTTTKVNGRALYGIKINLNDMPDMAQTLAVVALFATGRTVIRNVGNLRVKETDRMEALRIELSKLGANVIIKGDDIRITPPEGNILLNADNGKPMSDENPVYIDTYDDHRMAMAFSIAGLRQAGLRINDPDCVNKTFPDFFKYLDYLRQPPDNAKG